MARTMPPDEFSRETAIPVKKKRRTGVPLGQEDPFNRIGAGTEIMPYARPDQPLGATLPPASPASLGTRMSPAPAPRPTAAYGSQNAPGTEQYMDTAFAGPEDTRMPPATLEGERRARAAQMKNQAVSLWKDTVRRRVAAFRAGDRATGEMLKAQENELSSRIFEFNRAMAQPMSPEQIEAGRETLKAQFPGAVAGMRSQYANEASDASDLVTRRADKLRQFLVPGEYGAESPHARGGEALTDPYAARQRAQGVAQVGLETAKRGLSEAERTERAYNPPETLQFSPLDETAMRGRRERQAVDIESVNRYLDEDEANRKAATELAATERAGALETAKVPGAAAAAVVAESQAKEKVAKDIATTGTTPGQATRKAADLGAQRKAERDAAEAAVGASGQAIYQNIQKEYDSITNVSSVGTSQEIAARFGALHSKIDQLENYADAGGPDAAAFANNIISDLEVARLEYKRPVGWDKFSLFKGRATTDPALTHNQVKKEIDRTIERLRGIASRSRQRTTSPELSETRITPPTQ